MVPLGLVMRTPLVAFEMIVVEEKVSLPACVLLPVKAMLAVLSNPGVLIVVLVVEVVSVMPDPATSDFQVGVLPFAERNCASVGAVEVPVPPFARGTGELTVTIVP